MKGGGPNCIVGVETISKLGSLSSIISSLSSNIVIVYIRGQAQVHGIYPLIKSLSWQWLSLQIFRPQARWRMPSSQQY